MNKRQRIFVAGHRGLVGSAIVEALKKRGYENLTLRTRAELNLMDASAVDRFLAQEKPDVVILAAAKVGGIYANATFGADFLHDNLAIQSNVIWGAFKAGVERLVFLGSSCIYPRFAPQPMPETCLLQGELEITNRPYAIAKIAGLEMVNTLRHQYGMDYFSVMPTNLYGPGDNFHPENSHVLPAFVRRFQEAARTGQKEVVVWGDGTPRREFMHASDCADAIVYLAETLAPEAMASLPAANLGFWHVNVGSGHEVTIKDLANLIADAANFRGKLVFDASKPNGTPRKLLDTTFLNKVGWRPHVSLKDGIRGTVEWFKNHVEKAEFRSN